MTTVTLKVSGMACGGCASKVKQALEGIAGVTNADVTLENGHVEVTYTESAEANRACFQTVIEDLGFDVDA